jgi:hypothetical protein
LAVITWTAQACQGAHVGRKRRGQRLALAGAHLGDLAKMQHRSADELHVVMTQANRPARRFPYCRERLRQQRAHGLSGAQPVAESASPAVQFIIGAHRRSALKLAGPCDDLEAPARYLVGICVRIDATCRLRATARALSWQFQPYQRSSLSLLGG